MSIGIFDSGVGGLSVLKVLQAQFPNEQFIYFADQAYIPYGTRPTSEIQSRCYKITDFFIAQGCKLIVIACNTATAAAINELRDQFPQIPFVGMEPAIKPAVTLSQTGRIGVLATANTFKSQRYAALSEKFARDVTLVQDPCLGLVELIEQGKLNANETKELLTTAVTPMQAQDVDTIILGCTHYPFIQMILQQIIGEEIRLIDPAEAIARQVGRLAKIDSASNQIVQAPIPARFWTTGNKTAFTKQIETLLNVSVPQESLSFAPI